MGFTLINKLPTSAEVRGQFSLAPELAEIRHARDEKIKKVSAGGSGEFVVVIDPRLADDEEFVCDYAGRLVKVQGKTKDKLITIPWVYTSRPRTTDERYMGMIYQPDLEKRPDMSEGILAVHHMHMRVLRGTGSSTIDEMLYPENMNYLSDVMSYAAVDAHSMENQFHRLMTSGCDMSVGMKNLTSEDLTVMLSFAAIVQLPYDFTFRSSEIQCPGNSLAHTILRGVMNKKGQCTPNYHYEDLELLFDLYNKRRLQNPTCIMDVNHVNPDKQHQEQIRIAKEVPYSRRRSGDIRNLVKGLMIESYIKPGSQKTGECRYGKSIIDSCLGWDDTERLLYEATDNLDQHNNMIQANKNEQQKRLCHA